MVATTDNKRRYNGNGNDSNGSNHNGNYNNSNNRNNSGYNSNSNYQRNNYRGRAPENIENMPCHIHPGARHKLVECSTFQRQFMKRETGIKTTRSQSKKNPRRRKRELKEIIKNPNAN